MRYQFTGGQSGVNDPVDPNTQRPRPKPKAKRNTRQPQQQTFNDPVDPTRQTGIQQQAPQATPMPFAQRLVQSGMMTGNQPMRNREGQILPALTPGYSVNPMHPAWRDLFLLRGR